MMLYELIAHDNILDVKVQFRKLLDQISPFYQDRLKELLPQERALIETVALMRDEPRTPATIASRMRKTPQQTFSLPKRMAEARYLTISEKPPGQKVAALSHQGGIFRSLACHERVPSAEKKSQLSH